MCPCPHNMMTLEEVHTANDLPPAIFVFPKKTTA
jgi:hypothetical protein